MRYRRLGKSGIEASAAGFGAWALGGWMWGGTDKNDPLGAIHAAIDHGITLFDTAPMYGTQRRWSVKPSKAAELGRAELGPDRKFNRGDVRLTNPWYQVENRTKVDRLLAKLGEVADAKGATVSQVVIAWTISQHGCSHALVGARDAEQATANAKAGELELSANELKSIRHIVDETNL